MSSPPVGPESWKIHRPALGKHHLALLYLRWVGGTLLVTSTTGWAAIAWLGLHANLPDDQKLLVFFLEGTLLFTISCAATLLRLVYYYNTLYNTEKNTGFVKNVYPDRTWLQSKYIEFLESTDQRFVVLGSSLHTFMSTRGIEKALMEVMNDKSKPNLEVHFCFMKPDSPEVKQREREEAIHAGRISEDSRAHIEVARRWRANMGDASKRFHIRIREGSAPIGFFLVSDDALFFEPYLYGMPGRTAPTFQLNRSKLNAEAWDALYQHIESQMHLPGVTNAPPAGEARFITSFGAQADREKIKKAVFLDRDGVLIEDVGYLSDAKDIRLMQGVPQALSRLSKHFRLILVTNQSGIARGILTERDLADIHGRLLSIFEEQSVYLDAIFYCPHLPNGKIRQFSIECNCRKPAAGMIHDGLTTFDLDPKNSFMIGDRQRDTEAGRIAGLRTILLNDGESPEDASTADVVMHSMGEIATTILDSLTESDLRDSDAGES